MLNQQFKIAWRSLKKQPFFTLLNTLGLAIGMAGVLLIALFIYDEFSFDKMFPDADRIHRINVDIKFGGAAHKAAVVSAPMGATMQNDYPQIELVTRFRHNGSLLLKHPGEIENAKELQTTFVDSTFFQMFGLDLLHGNPKTALTKPNTLILTKTAANKYFNVENALGKSLILDNEETYLITGIMDDLPKNSMFRNHSVFMAMEGHPDSKDDLWGNHNYPTFLKLFPSAKAEDLIAPLKEMLGTYLIPWAQTFYPGITEETFLKSGNYLNYSTIPLTDIHLNSSLESELSTNSDIQNVYILSIIGLFLILLAVVNFMNLSTAHSLKRAKEVGIRKTLGSSKRDLVRQFLTESSIISFGSLAFAVGLAQIALPHFNQLAGKEIILPLNNPFFLIILVVSTVLLSLISGSYPAFFMSRFSPIKVLNGGGDNTVEGGNIRNSLVIFQFAISVFLIVSTLVVFQQLKYIQNKDLGFEKDQVLVIDDVYSVGSKIFSFKQEVQRLNKIKKVSLSSFFPTPSSRNDSSFNLEDAPGQESAVSMQKWDVDHDYVSTLDLEIIEGRDFDLSFGSDSLGIILNESAIQILGLKPEEAIGKRITDEFINDNPIYYHIIGIVKNFHFSSLRNKINGLSLKLGRHHGAMAVKLEAGDFKNTLSSIEEIWSKLAPGQPFNYYFMEESFNNTYDSEQRLGRIFITFTILSILIACLGLFGLAAYNAEKRVKEIGIRKVLGASVSQITFGLSIDFLKLVLVSIVIALPIAWYAMNKWLEDFSFRIEISLWVLALAALLAILISIATVSFQSIKAAIVNPVKSLKSE